MRARTTLAKKMGVDRRPTATSSAPFTLGVTDVEPADDGRRLRDLRRPRHALRRRARSPRSLNSAGKTIEDYPPTVPAGAAQRRRRRRQRHPQGRAGAGRLRRDAGLGLNQQSAGKTGTTNDNKAVWFVGYTPNLATVAMIAGANSQGHPITLNGQTVGGVYIEARTARPSPARCGATR